ncbi:hypothetical protein F5Y03DRAFT_405866 [Xylaria venustula]|nr:hypothetical protein F5Y03DRAFT_405866 [Xylaria venustula]
METIPDEIMINITASLPTGDLGRFRLASRRCAETGLPVMARQLRVLNTVTCLQNFNQFLTTIPAVYTRALTIYHSKWPIFSHGEWQTHPLLLREKVPHSGLSAPGSLASSAVLQEYQEFLSRDDERRYHSDLEIVAEILGRLPNLLTVTIETLQPWGRVPGPNPWTSPTFNTAMNRMVRCVIHSLHKRPRVHTLDIRGKTPQAVLLECPIPTTITTLRIKSLVGGPLAPSNTPLLIPGHASLRVLEVNCPARPRLVFLPNPLPELQALYLQGCVVQEESLVSLYSTPALCRMHLSNITLTKGTWASCLSRMRAISHQPSLELSGIFDGHDLLCSQFYVQSTTLGLLQDFMDSKIPWPF